MELWFGVEKVFQDANVDVEKVIQDVNGDVVLALG